MNDPGHHPALTRPFYFMVVLWGARFRSYFLDYCLPSLLAPNNIPALTNHAGNKFIVCTTPEDWAAMETTPIFAALKRHLEPMFVEIPAAPPGRSGCEHMGIGHLKATEIAFRDKAYGVLVAPDYILNDGAIAAAQRHAIAGKRLVLVPALRFAEEPLFEKLQALGVIEPDAPLSARGQALVATGAQLVAAGVDSLHSEVQRYGWESPCFSDFPAACWWPVPGEDGMVVHSLSWGPLLMDYGALSHHDTTCLETWTLDGDYLYGNFGARLEDIHVVADSDEVMEVSWAPLDDRAQDLSPLWWRRAPIIGNLVKGAILRNTVFDPVFDPLKRRLLFVPVRWHARPLAPAWRTTEAAAMKTLRLYLYGLDPAAGRRSGFVLGWPLSVVLRVAWAIRRAIVLIRTQFRFADRIRTMLGRALRGDRMAWVRIGRRLRIFGQLMLGMPVRND